MAKRGSLKKFAKKEAKERPIRFRRYKYLFLIVCEDQKTEPEYFEEYVSKIQEDTIYLKPIGTGRDPKGVVQRAIIEKNILEKEAKREVDEVWVVFDKDDAGENTTKIQRFKDAFHIAEKENFQVAYSNEVFELWLLLHFINVDKETPLPRAEIYQRLREQFQKAPTYADYEYDHRVIDPRTLEIVFKFGNRDSAIKRAQFLLEYHKDCEPIDANPITRVHILVQVLLDWIKYFS